MIDFLVTLFESVPHSVATVFIAALPIAELRGAIPVAIGVYGMDPLKAYMLAVIGNMLPVIPLLLFLGVVSDYLRRWARWDVFFHWLFTRTYHRHNARFERYGTVASCCLWQSRCRSPAHGLDARRRSYSGYGLDMRSQRSLGAFCFRE